DDDDDDDDDQDDDVDEENANKNDDEEGDDDDDDDQEEGSEDEQAFDEECEEFIHLNLSTHDEVETRDEESFDPLPKTPENMDDEGKGEENLKINIGNKEEQDEEDEEDELYRDVNINLGRGVQMADVHTTQEFKDLHVTLTLVNPDGQQQSSSVSSQFVTRMFNPTPDAGIESIFKTTFQMDVQTPISVAPLPVSLLTLAPLTIATITTIQQAPTPLTTASSMLLQDLPNFGKLMDTPGSCKSLVELEFFLEEVYKEMIDQLDWVNPEGASSRKYTTSVTKTKAADYGYIKWIEDLVPRIMWIQEPIGYDKHALWGISHWGRKHQQFYGFAINRESARDVYSKCRIIAVTELKIVEWHNYKHFDWIQVHRDDDKLYKFKEGDFKRLYIQDIKDMLLLLVQGKLINLTVEECFAFNVSLRMFTRSIIIQRRMEDLQLSVESYQKKLNLTRPDTYHSDLKRKEAYISYSNPRGFIYQNKDKKNRLMRIDELHKFSNGTLTDVYTTLDDLLRGFA
nr:hypothetical protein [Tanacetum cinerariifolium]